MMTALGAEPAIEPDDLLEPPDGANAGVPPDSRTAAGAPPQDPEDHTHGHDPSSMTSSRQRRKRIEKECSDLEKKLRGLNATQQRSLLEKLADSSRHPEAHRQLPQSVVPPRSHSSRRWKATQPTADADPQYHVDLALVGHVVAFQRHR